jgi:hypothetical protein
MPDPYTDDCQWCGQPKAPATDGDFITCPNAHDICIDCCPCCPGKFAKCNECGTVLSGVPSTWETLEALCPEHQKKEEIKV